MPFFSVIAILFPFAAAAYAASVYSKSSADTMGAAIGQGIAAYLIFATGCALGETSAVLSLVRAERPRWLGVIGVMLNLSAAIPPILVAIRRP